MLDPEGADAGRADPLHNQEAGLGHSPTGYTQHSSFGLSGQVFMNFGTSVGEECLLGTEKDD